MAEILAYTPKDVKAALSLSSVEAAKALWRDTGFPGFEDQGRMLVDADDLRSWWKRRKDQLLAEKGWKNDNAGRGKESEEGERGEEAPEGIQGRSDASGWLEVSKELLRTNP